MKNGIQLLFISDPKSKIVQVCTMIQAGSVRENKKTVGTSHFLEHVLLESHPQHPGSDIYKTLDFKGIDYNAFTDSFLVGYWVNGNPQDLTFMLDYILGIYTNPNIPDNIVERERNIILQELSDKVNDPLYPYYEMTEQLLYPPHGNQYNPLAIPLNIEIENTHHLNKNNLTEFYNTYYTPSATTIIVSGNFNVKNTKQHITNALGSLPTKNKIPYPIIKGRQETKEILIGFKERREAEKTTINIYFQTNKFNSQKNREKSLYTAILSLILTSGLTSILNQNLRIKNQWVYGVKSSSDVNNTFTTLEIELETSNEYVEGCVTEIFKELKNIKQGKLDKKTMSKIKNNLNNSYKRQIINPIELTHLYGTQVSLGLPLWTIKQTLNKSLSVTANNIVKISNELFLSQNTIISHEGSVNFTNFLKTVNL